MLQKYFIFIFIAITAICASPHDIPPDDDYYLPSQARIQSGRPVTSVTYAPCFTTIVVFLSNVTRICGGCVISPGNRVLTAASCILSTYQNATSTNMIFSFGIVYLPRLMFRMTNIAIPSGYSVSSNTSTNDLAVITLNLNVISLIPTMRASNLSNVATKDAFVGEEVIACGFGVRNNLGIRPVFLNCVTLTVVRTETCFTQSTATTCAPGDTTTETTPSSAMTTTTTASISPVGVLCTRNTDGRGVCHNDEGSPIFSNSTGSMVQIGVISYVVNRNSNFCGNLVVITQVGNFRNFIDNA